MIRASVNTRSVGLKFGHWQLLARFASCRPGTSATTPGARPIRGQATSDICAQQGLINTVRLDGRRDVAVVLTDRGRDLLECAPGPRPRASPGVLRGPQEALAKLEHDSHIYRAYLREAERLAEREARIDRVVLDYELKREYQQWLHERDRDRDDYDGHPDRDAREVEAWAHDHDLPYFDEQVHFPDLRIEYEEVDGRRDHIDVEITTIHYRGAHGAAAARSGFSCYRISSARIVGRTGRSGGGGRHPRLAEELLELTADERVKAVAEFGFTERQARFLVTVMLHGGVCVPRQYATFAGIAYGHKVNRFFDKLVRRGFAIVCDCRHNRARLYHVHHTGLYRAIGEPHSRFRRPVSAALAVERVMLLDGVVASPDLRWLGTDQEKVNFFTETVPSVPPERFPHVIVGGRPHRVRWFPEKLPIGVESTGRVVFFYLVPALIDERFHAFLQGHGALLRALPAWTVRLLVPRHAGPVPAFEASARKELMARVAPETIVELRWYFAQCRDANGRTPLTTADRFWRARQTFSTPRCRELYRRWMRDGEAAFEVVSSSVIADALERGTGRLESQALPCSYQHLSPLVASGRSTPKRG